MRSNFLLTIATLMIGTGFCYADLIDSFSGLDAVFEVGVSGLQSSYYCDTKSNQAVTGPSTSTELAVLGDSRVCYPSGVGEVPSPGGSVGTHFDQGGLGFLADGDSLVLMFAGGLDPNSGYYYSGWNTWYSQGDLFLTVSDSTGISHYALLNSWARDNSGDPININADYYAQAEAFHVSGGVGGSSLEGHLVKLDSDSDVSIIGGRGAYSTGNVPDGFDLRVFAQGGTDLGNANLTHGEIADTDHTWYAQSWTIPLASLSADGEFEVALHTAATCGNDQIGLTMSVPEPSTILLSLSGLVLLVRSRRPAC